jgi:hypothetical protein
MSDRQVVYVGIDVSKDSLSVDAGALFKGDVPNTPASIRGLIRKIGKQAGDGSVPHFCFESTEVERCWGSIQKNTAPA